VEFVDQVLGFSGRMLEVGDIVAEDSSFTNVMKLDPPLVPWLLQYETTAAVAVFLEFLQMARKAFASSDEKLALVDAAQRAVDEYLQNSGLMVMRTKVITAQKNEM
jgi:hypothetical protein